MRRKNEVCNGGIVMMEDLPSTLMTVIFLTLVLQRVELITQFN